MPNNKPQPRPWDAEQVEFGWLVLFVVAMAGVTTLIVHYFRSLAK